MHRTLAGAMKAVRCDSDALFFLPFLLGEQKKWEVQTQGQVAQTQNQWTYKLMLSYHLATQVANNIMNQLKDSCKQIQTVGSLRRQKPEVKDVDIIAIPEFSFEDSATLFGDTVQQNLLDMRLARICNGDQCMMQSNGPKIKRILVKAKKVLVPVDIYIASDTTWWTLLLIRTGSRNHNIALARRAIEKHMVLKADGTGLLTAGGDIIPINSEEEVFKHLNLPFKSPQQRG